MTPSVAELAAAVLRHAGGRERCLVAIAGPPGAGKSTLAEGLLAALSSARPGVAVLLPMDGFHLDNALLEALGLMQRKGAPETFDVAGLRATLERVRGSATPVVVPVFDRDLDLARAGARLVEPGHAIVLVEGNYLLLDEPPWSGLAGLFDLTIALEVDRAELRRRLVGRWLHHGLPQDRAVARAEGNDLVNATRVLERSRPADILCRQ